MRISDVKTEMEKWDLKSEEASLSAEEIEKKRDCMAQIGQLSHMRCSLLWQKARMKWLQEGDSNSRFFHSCINKRRRRNEILCLNFDGVRVDGVEQLKFEIMEHFRKHFQQSQWDRPVLDGVVFKQLDASENHALVAPFQDEEIRSAIWDCESSKSPGPDGVNFGFIKEFWKDIKADFMAFLLEFQKNGRLLKGSNYSFIVLIPKKDNPQKIGDYRPISLIGCMYKVLAKLLANSLRKVMNFLISDTQSAFVKGRQILDGVLKASKVVDEANKRNKKVVLFKVDFEKAYDSVGWKYLDFVMRGWVSWLNGGLGFLNAYLLQLCQFW